MTMLTGLLVLAVSCALVCVAQCIAMAWKDWRK